MITLAYNPQCQDSDAGRLCFLRRNPSLLNPRSGAVLAMSQERFTTEDLCVMAKEVPLTKGYTAIVDDEDYDRVVKIRWHVLTGRINSPTYASSSQKINGKWKNVSLHRYILNAPIGIQVDHRNGDGLDNRRANLRVASVAQNAYNRRPMKGSFSGYKGVRHKMFTRDRWIASIGHERRLLHIGMYDTAEEAARAYDAKAKELFGEFAYVNFPDE